MENQVEKLPEEIDEVDVLKLEKASMKEENLQLKLAAIQLAFEAAQRESNDLRAALRLKYKLGDNDQVELASRKITRKG